MTEFLTEKIYEKKEEKSLNSTILEKIKISSQETMLIKSVEKFFYKNIEKVNIMLPIVRGESNISLRVIDHFITNYSKRNRIAYNLSENNLITIFNVNSSYKSQLKAYNKKHFDPFCRGTRIPFFFDKDKCFITTIGQLNFFKWAISKNVINWVNQNLSLIELDMNKSSKKEKKKLKKSYKNFKLYKKPEINFYNNILDIPQEKQKIRIMVTFE
jgi:hypothetical protein